MPIGHEAPSPSRRALAGYPGVLEPARVDCTFTGPWNATQPRELRLGASGPAYVTVFRATQAALELGGAEAFAELRVDGFRLWGHVGPGVRLHPARPFLVAGYLLPGMHAELQPLEARAGTVTFALAAPKFVTPTAPPRDRRACADVGLAIAELDPMAALGSLARRDGFEIAANTAVPLATTPGGAPVAELRFDEGAHVVVVEERGDLARIVVDEYYDTDAGSSVVGWVPRVRLAPTGPFGHPGGRSSGVGPPTTSGLSRARRHVQCTRTVPLVIEQGDARHLAGAIEPGTKFGVVDAPGDTMVAITFDRIALALAPATRALVRRDALATCTDVPR